MANTLSIHEAAKLLGVEPTISKKELNKAWRKLAIKEHPDLKPGNEQRFKNLTLAFETISATHELARHTNVIDEEILDDDIRFMMKRMTQEQRDEFMAGLKELEQMDD